MYSSKKKINIAFLLCCTLVSGTTFFVVEFDWSKYHFYEQSGQLGDALGGSSAPIIGLFSIYLLLRTLNEQIKFNKEQKKLAFDEQFKS